MSGGTVVVGFNSEQSSVTFNGTTYTANANNPTNGVYYYTGTGITEVGGFIDNTQLVSVNIQPDVTSVGARAFQNCTSLTSLIFDSDSTLTSIGMGAFRLCTSLTSIALPSSLTSLSGGFSFNECSALISITFPSTLTYIGEYVFARCTSLISVNIPNSVITIAPGAFQFCTSLTTITYDTNSTLTSIGQYSFTNCSSLMSITIPNTVTSIGQNTFSDCSSLTTVIFDAISVLTSIAQFTFYNCTSLKTITFDASSNLTSIAQYAFYNCSSLTSITIPSGVTSINSNAFNNCSKLTTARFLQRSNVMPSSAYSAFQSTTALTKAYMYSTNTNANTYFTTYLPSVQIIFIDYPCFLEGSKILTNKGYVKIEILRKGDLLQTEIDGCKKIDMIGWREIHHQAVEERKKDQLYKCTPENYPELFEDLVLTGCHSILIDKFKNEEERENTIKVNGDTYMTGNKYRLPACADERALVYETEGHYKVYHVALENEYYYRNYGIYANGLLVESCSKRYLKELSGMELL